jgi:phytoene/squalene synthetase
MTASADFYQPHLDRVSRSFAFCIRQLPVPLRDWVGISYLLCRVVDTIEDADWANPDQQLQAFKSFDAALVDLTAAPHLTELSSVFKRESQHVSDGERLLLADAEILLGHFHRLSEPVQAHMRELILSMSKGMQHYCHERRGGSLHLRTMGDVNQYCFFVAGLVGELLAKLVARVEPNFQLSQANLLRAHHFGLFLQKVNLLKDQVADETQGRHFIPSRELVEISSRENAVYALEFLKKIPQAQVEFRRFCAWSLFLGIEALTVARRSLVEHRVLKVPRQQTAELLEAVEMKLLDDSALDQLFADSAARLGWRVQDLSVRSPSAKVPDWIAQIYQGLLEPEGLNELVGNA